MTVATTVELMVVELVAMMVVKKVDEMALH